MDKITLGLHETLELHELLSFKTLCMTKSQLMSGLVQDQELKSLLDQDVNSTKGHIQQLQNFFPEGI